MSEQGYNGWANYPTWAVNLWLGNDEALYRLATEKVVAAGLERGPVADALKSWVRDVLAPDLGATFAADLLGYALDLVDWYEIADAWIEGSARDRKIPDDQEASNA